ncbi:MAG: hypothetical protein M1318_04125 [Firmicutes bacterium]|jgi:hypothetical protein|nr:hypothetical protein [Bacillota bacterium]
MANSMRRLKFQRQKGAELVFSVTATLLETFGGGGFARDKFRAVATMKGLKL